LIFVNVFPNCGEFRDLAYSGAKVDTSAKYKVGAGQRCVQKDSFYPTTNEHNAESAKWDDGVSIDTFKVPVTLHLLVLKSPYYQHKYVAKLISVTEEEWHQPFPSVLPSEFDS